MSESTPPGGGFVGEALPLRNERLTVAQSDPNFWDGALAVSGRADDGASV
jgi:hypothetical protein